jgi:hypothetical protein
LIALIEMRLVTSSTLLIDQGSTSLPGIHNQCRAVYLFAKFEQFKELMASIVGGAEAVVT